MEGKGRSKDERMEEECGEAKGRRGGKE